MNIFRAREAKTFNLLTIGRRSDGKTTFLAGSYARLRAERGDGPLWFECQDGSTRQDLENILNYVGRTGLYPPATMKITDFNFSLKQNRRLGPRTLCHFRYRDLPGEWCHRRNRDFRRVVVTSHGCCLFIDAHALLNNTSYAEELRDIQDQVESIASLVYLNELQYAIAIILTKCDLLDDDTDERLAETLRPLTAHLEHSKTSFRIFHSAVRVAPNASGSGAVLASAEGDDPLAWLVWEISRDFHPSWKVDLLGLFGRWLPSLRTRQSKHGLASLSWPT